ncbi:cache domain-containing protein [Maridesulfovibrio sp.]|uniref:cache domain-containing protein n=1 Tax=Maridesulfovibrio sp. TaxID=2795000 RepID=UPI002A18C38C|nr:cache domain-containing protein [Maridesulfovibrio sp.]
MKSIVSTLSRQTMALCFSSILIFGALTVYFMVTDYRNDLKEVEKDIMGTLEENLMREVSRVHNFIDFSRNNVRVQAVKDIQDLVQNAYRLTERLYSKHSRSMPEKELRSMIKAALRSLVPQENPFYLFVVDQNGFEQLNTGSPNIEPVDISNSKSVDGRSVIKEIVRLAQNQGEGFIDYLWSRPGYAGNRHEKKSFIKIFKPYGWIIGSGVYYATIREAAQHEVLERLSKLNTPRDGYIFAGTYSGVSLLGPAQGRNVIDVRDANGVKVVRELIKLAKSGGGFMQYKIPSIDPQYEPHRKLSYCTSVPQWKWYIGAGADANILDEKLTQKKQKLQDALREKISIICGLLLIYSIAIILFSEKFKQMLRDSFNSFERFFRDGMEHPAKIDRSEITFREFDQMAAQANAMINSREEAKNALLKSEITYREIFNASKDAIAVLDLEKKIFADVNQTFLDFFGLSRTKAIGMSPEEINFNTPPYDGRYAAELFNKARTGETVHFEWMVKNSAGEPFWTDNLARVATIGGKKKLLIVMRDVTERKKMNKTMIQTEKMMSIGGLAAGMAHEINNPLGVIMQVTQNIIRRTSPTLKSNLPIAEQCNIDLDNLRNYMDKRGITGYLRSIQESGQRAASIVRSMLDFSRRSNSSKSYSDIEAVIESAISLASNDYNLKKQYDFKKIKIIRDYSSPPIFNFTEMEISQVILNLIKNAAQALSEENNLQKIPTITIRTSTDRQSVRVEIEDNGPGIPAERLKRIFEPFYTTKSPGSGTGLGLSVSYFIITQNHGGTITADSNPGEGTKFTITLPML